MSYRRESDLRKQEATAILTKASQIGYKFEEWLNTQLKLIQATGSNTAERDVKESTTQIFCIAKEEIFEAECLQIKVVNSPQRV